MKEFDSQFEKDVYEGMTAEDKYLPSKWKYDETGSKLFQKVMELAEYHPTQCEYEIFTERDLVKMLNIGAEGIDLFELGTGDGYKTKLLLKGLQKANIDFTYRPIDIDKNILDELTSTIKQELSGVEVEPLVGEYFTMLDSIKTYSSRPKVILFLGSNIGNLLHPKAIDFLTKLSGLMLPRDKAMIGFDLKKKPSTVLSAYNDTTGVTSSFNLNLLTRINREMDANFDINKFFHYPVYDPMTGTIFNYLVSSEAQRVQIKKLGINAMFGKWESIQTEISQKYTHQMINWLLSKSELQTLDYVTDSKGYFAEYVIEKASWAS